jgi:serine/threonine-protein kinase
MNGVTPLAPGDVFGDFRIESVAGRGGMGVVYRAVQLDLGRPVALKLIASDRAADPAFRERFQRESRLAALIDHPNVVPVHGAGEEDGQLYLVMRYVPGTDLHRLLKHEGPLEPERAANIVAQVASALDAAHAAGLVHRDVKPANVLIAGDHAYLGDFGLTRMLSSEEQLTETGQWLGTTDFSSPEQLQGERVDARADIYSLGCVLHAALLGGPPFPRSTIPATLLAHLNDPPPRPSERGAPQGFDRVMARALAKHPADRYPSAGDLGRAALAAARGESVTESERSVAIGPAAPSTNGHVAPPTALTVAEPTAHTRAQTRVQPEEETTVLPPRKRRRRALAGLFVGIAAAGTAVALIGNPGAGDGADTTRAPLSEDEVRNVAQDFAQAYQDEDGTALKRLLTPGVARVLPSGVARGRARVVREYESQFRAQETEGYSLDDLAVQGGRAGRASGSYTVDRKDKQPIEGRIVLGMVRDRGQPRIGLIAVTPNS